MTTGTELTLEAIADRGTPPTHWEQPQPLPDAAEKPMAFDCGNLLPDAFKAYVEDCSRRLSCPPEMVALPLMVAAGATLGRGLGIRPKARDKWTEFTNLWGAVIAPPSSMKSPGLDAATKAITRIETARRESYLSLKSQYDDECFTHEATLKAARAAVEKAARNGEDLSRYQLPTPPPEPAERRIMIASATPEKLVAIHAQNPRGLLVLRDELLGWLRTLDRPGREGERALFLEGWTGKNPYRADTIGRGSDYVKACCLSVWGGIQPGPFKMFLEAPESEGRADGLLQRFSLLAWPEPLPFKLNDERPDEVAFRKVEQTFQRFAELNADKVEVGTVEDEDAPPYLRFDADGQGAFLGWLESFMNRLQGITPESFQGHLSKYRKTLPGLALIIELADNPRAESVSLASWQRAEAWGQYLESHLRKIYAPAIRFDLLAAERILERIQDGSLPDGFSTRDLHKADWGGLTDLETVRAGLATLAAHGWIKEAPPEKGPGRPSEKWMINPETIGGER